MHTCSLCSGTGRAELLPNAKVAHCDHCRRAYEQWAFDALPVIQYAIDEVTDRHGSAVPLVDVAKLCHCGLEVVATYHAAVPFSPLACSECGGSGVLPEVGGPEHDDSEGEAMRGVA